MDACYTMASNRILKCEIHKNEKSWRYKPHKNEARCMCIKLICQLTPNVLSQLSRCCEQTPAAYMHLLKCVPHELLCCVCQSVVLCMPVCCVVYASLLMVLVHGMPAYSWLAKLYFLE